MRILLSIGDAYLERIPQYAVTSIKLHLEVLNESVTMSGKWSRKSHRVRFQDAIYVSPPSFDVGIRLSFTLIALLSNEASDFKVIGSGVILTSEVLHGVQQTVMLSSSNMTNLMARLSISTTFEDAQNLGNNTSHGITSGNIPNDLGLHRLKSHSNVRVASVNLDGSNHEAHRKAARKRTSTSSNRKISNSFVETSDERVADRPKSSNHSRTSTNENMTSFHDSSNRDLILQQDVGKDAGVRVAGLNILDSNLHHWKHGEILSETLDSSHSKHRAEGEKASLQRSVQVYHTVQIQTETLKESEACERLRMALERKDGELRKAQLQLENSLSSSSKVLKERGRLALHFNDMAGTDYSSNFKKDESKFIDSGDPPELSESRSTNYANEGNEISIRGSDDAFSRNQSSKSSVGQSVRDIGSRRSSPSMRTSTSNGVNSCQRSSGSILRLSGSLNASSAEAHRVAKANLEARESQNEERKILDIRKRLLAAEERRLEALNNQKTRAMVLSLQATCKAKAIKEAALMSSKAYDRLRNDFDKKEEMLTRVQDELNSSTNTMRRVARYNATMRGDDYSRERESRPSSGMKSSTWRASEQGEALRSRGRGRGRASSAPARAKSSSIFQSKSLPFSDLRKKSSSFDEGSMTDGDCEDESQVTQRRRSQGGRHHLSHVHYIPSVSSSKADGKYTHSSKEYAKFERTKLDGTFSGSSRPSTSVDPVHAMHYTSSNSINRSTDELQQRDKREVSGSPQILYDSLEYIDSALSRKRLAILVHDRVHALKQKIADASPAEGESILRMIRNVLPLEVAKTRPDKVVASNSRAAGPATPSVAEDERSSVSEVRGPRITDHDGRIKSSSVSETRVSHSNMDSSQATCGGQDGITDDHNGQNDQYDDDDDDSVETSNLVAQLWDILGVPVTAEQRSPPRKLLDDRTNRSNLPDKQARTFKHGGRDSAVDRSLDAVEPVNATDHHERYVTSAMTGARSASQSEDATGGSTYRGQDEDVSQTSPIAAVRPNRKTSRDVMPSRAKSSSSTGPEGSGSGSGGRWWRNDYLALKWEIKHIVESASPLRAARSGVETSLDIDDSISTTAVVRGEVTTKEKDISGLEAPPSPSSSSIHQKPLTFPGPSSLAVPSPSHYLTTDLMNATPAKRHLSINSKISYSDGANATSSLAYSSAAPQTLLEQFSLPSPESSSRNYTPERIRRATVHPAILTPPYTSSQTSLVLAASRAVVTSPRQAVHVEDRRGFIAWRADQRGDESIDAEGDSSAVDTSACISRQIDDVGRAINTLQARIASYMYISPDASPADALIKSKLKGTGMLLEGEGDDMDASSSSDTFLGETSARADTSSGVSKVPGGAERSEQIAVEEFTATAKLQFVSYTGHQDASQPVGRVNEVNDLDSSSKKRTNNSITNECIAIRVDGDRDPMIALTEDGPKECYEVSTRAKEIHGGGVTATVHMGNAQEEEADDDVKEEQLATFSSPYKTVESPFPSSSHSPTSSSSHPGASASTMPRYSSQNFKYPYPFLGFGTGIRTGAGTGSGTGSGRGVLTSSGNMFHNLMFAGMGGTGTGTNTEDVSLSVRDMDMGNISYDTMSFAADRMMTLGQSSLLDLNNTEDLLKDIFRDEEKDDDDDDDDDDGVGDGADGTAATVMRWNADPQSSLTGPHDKEKDKDEDCNADKDSDSDSSTDDFDGIFRLP